MRNIYILFICFFGVANSICAQKIIFSPPWTPQAQFTGYYVALEKGFYKDLGLDVDIIHPTTSNSVSDMLNQKEADIMPIPLLEAMNLVDKGLDLVNLMQISQNSAMTIVAQSQYTSLDQLVGKRIAGWKNGFTQLPICYSLDKQQRVEWVFCQNVLNLFISSAVDGVLAMYYNEYFQVMNSGQHITQKNTFHFSEIPDYNIPEDGLYCKRNYYLTHKKQVDLFTQATIKGWIYAREHPEEALQIVCKVMKKENTPCSMAHQRWMLEKMLELQIDKTTKKVSFNLTKEVFNRANDLLYRNKIIAQPLEYEKFYLP